MARDAFLIARKKIDVSGSGVTLYTAPPNDAVVMRVITATNLDSSAHPFSFYIVANGQAVADDYALIRAASIPANGTLVWDGFQPIPSNNFLYADTDADGKINVIVGGEKGRP